MSQNIHKDEDDHVDRGDTQRSIGFYKESASEAARARRQRELELEVLTGTIRGWEGEGMEHLGDIVKMGAVVMGHGLNKKDKYLVLFPSTLLMLSVSNRLSAFIYEVKTLLSCSLVSSPLYFRASCLCQGCPSLGQMGTLTITRSALTFQVFAFL